MTVKHEKSYSIQQVFVILVLAMFMVFSMLLVVLGAMAYCGMEEKSVDANNARILCAFVRSAVETQEAEGNVLVEDGTLVIENDYDGEIYRQYIYLHEGELRQQFISAERAFRPENGDAVCRAMAFVPSLSGNLLTVDMQDEQGMGYTLYQPVRTVKTEGGGL